MSELILYQTEDGVAEVKLRSLDGSVWLSQAEIAELFATTIPNVNIHIRNVLKEGELVGDSVIKESLIAAADGKRYRTKLYRLEMIMALGYRVKGPRGVQFRQWATTHLSEYPIKGFVMDDERLKNPGGWSSSFWSRPSCGSRSARSSLWTTGAKMLIVCWHSMIARSWKTLAA